MSVETTRDGATTLLRLSNGAVNALSVGNGFVAQLQGAILAAIADPQCRVIVVAGAGKLFCGGADIADFDRDPALVGRLRDLVALVEASEKPIIMAIHGVALGGGLELAMAGHYRIAQANARLGLPEVTLGLLPGAGGTQRLPRLIGTAPALDMMLSGKPIGAARALELGLVDRVVDGDVAQAALEIAATAPPPVRRSGASPLPADLRASIDQHQAKLRPGLSRAPHRILDCVEALSDDLASGLAVEASLFGELMASAESRGLRHAFSASARSAASPTCRQRPSRARSPLSASSAAA